MIDAAERAGQPALLDLTAGPVPAREEQLLAALPAIIAALRGQGVAEEELFPAVVTALRGRVGNGERAGEHWSRAGAGLDAPPLRWPPAIVTRLVALNWQVCA